MNEQVDVIVRFHDMARLPELTRCVFSLAGQSYRPLRIILALQRFSAADIAATRAALAPFLDDQPGVHLSVVNWELSAPADARSILLNLGVSIAQGRYVAFLDYDDVLYPEAYAMLVEQLKKSDAAIAFASVRILKLEIYQRYFYAASRVVPPYGGGANLADLFRNNFCPLHSYVIDRGRLPADMLNFNSALTLEEDYDVLLRICAALPSDFTLLGAEIGDYYYKTDGSNTVPVNGGLPSAVGLDRYRAIRAAIEHRKASTVVAPAVQKSLGLAAATDGLTIRQLIDRLPAGA